MCKRFLPTAYWIIEHAKKISVVQKKLASEQAHAYTRAILINAVGIIHLRRATNQVYIV
jgi:hypothetical protein